MPVLEILFDVFADLEPVFRRDGDVPAVEQRVQVAAQQDAVIRFVRPLFGVRPDVGGVEDGQDPHSRILRIGNPRFANFTAQRTEPSGDAPRGQDRRCSSLGGQAFSPVTAHILP
jgi:hypothetical protein